MRVENYRCSEDQIEEMAEDHYWFFMRGMPSSGRPTSTMDPYRTPLPSDWDSYRTSDMRSRSDMSGRPSDMYSSFDMSDRSSDMAGSSDLPSRPSDQSSSSGRFDRSSDVFSSSARFERPSDIYSSSEHLMDSSHLHGSSSDDYVHSSHSPHDGHGSSSDRPGTDYRDSLPFICKGKL